jgi:hypothetical protein
MFVNQFEMWQFGDAVIHPHPAIGRLFTKIGRLKNHFDVDVSCCLIVCFIIVNFIRL